MEVTHVDVTIHNPAEPARSWEGRFLVDTGAIDSLVPRRHLEAIGLEPKGRRVYETTDGREVEMDVTTADIEVMGEITAGLIVVGDADIEPLLGVTALESVGIEVDPQNQRLKKLPAVRLKGLRGRVDSRSVRRPCKSAAGALGLPGVSGRNVMMAPVAGRFARGVHRTSIDHIA